MSLSKEVKTGVLVTAALGIFFVGYYFLKGANLFSNNKDYYCFYDNVEGLQSSANIQIRGLIVGRVSDMKLIDNKGVRVTLTVSKNVEITQGTAATLISPDLLGGKAIELTLGAGHDPLAAGATIPAGKQMGVIDNVTSALTPRLQELKATIASIDTTLAGVQAILVPIKATAYNLASLTGALDKQSGEIANIMHNASSFTGNLAKQNDTVNQLLSHFNQLSRQLANAPIQQTVADLQNTTGQLKAIIQKINGDQGSLGLLINNKDLYNNLNTTINSITKLTDDLKAHPSRYINVTVFGKKKS